MSNTGQLCGIDSTRVPHRGSRQRNLVLYLMHVRVSPVSNFRSDCPGAADAPSQQAGLPTGATSWNSPPQPWGTRRDVAPHTLLTSCGLARCSSRPLRDPLPLPEDLPKVSLLHVYTLKSDSDFRLTNQQSWSWSQVLSASPQDLLAIARLRLCAFGNACAVRACVIHWRTETTQRPIYMAHMARLPRREQVV
ncbi:hypothetical protein VTK56DRAFT_8742 [Thermocarpiscus australiensis]